MKFAPAKALFLLLTTFSVLGTSAGSRQEARAPVQAQGTAATAPPTAPIQTVPGMPPAPDPKNIYSETTPNHMSSAVKEHLERIYVPNLRSKSLSVIDPHTMKVVDTLRVEKGPQHVVPSWDLSTLWVANNAERGNDGSLTPVDPRTGKVGKAIPVDDGNAWSKVGDLGVSFRCVADHHHFADPFGLQLTRDAGDRQEAIHGLPAGHGHGVVVEDLVGDRHVGGDGLAELFDLLGAAAGGVAGGELVTRLPADEHGEAIALEFLHGDACVRQKQDDFSALIFGCEPGGGKNAGRRQGSGRRSWGVFWFCRFCLLLFFQIAEGFFHHGAIRLIAGGQ